MSQPSDSSLFQDKHRRWNECLNADHEGSVHRQIARLIWNAAVFEIVLKARDVAPQADEGGVQLSGLLHELIDNCFFDSQLAAIRRLTDRHPLYGPKGVDSLGALLQDMEANQHRFKRSNMIAAEGIPTDLEPLRSEIEDHRREQLRQGKRAFVLPNNGYHLALTRQQQIDQLTKTDAKSRSPDDCVDPNVFKSLKEKLRGDCDQVHEFVDKFIAHNASQESRAAFPRGHLTVTLSSIRQAHKNICVVANFVSIYLLGGSSSASLAYPAFDQFKYIERPLVNADQIDSLRQAWNQYEGVTQQWSSSAVVSFANELGVDNDT